MSRARLSPLDAAFLDIESGTAPMHVGWAAAFAAPEDRSRPDFAEIRAHIGARLGRAPRYRQRLVGVPLGLADPVWVDDEHFDVARHVRRAAGDDLGELADEVMSQPLAPDRPLWELWIADRLHDGRIGVVGKAHHCLVDGLAAVELMALLLDPTPEPERGDDAPWVPAPTPSAAELIGEALRERIGQSLDMARAPLAWASSPRRILDLPPRSLGIARTAAHTTVPPARPNRLNGAMPSARHLAWCARPLEDLKAIKNHFGTTINDVVLAASAGAIRDLLVERGERPRGLKAMVPVSVRAEEERWGNRIAFLFVALPCEEPDAVERLRLVHETMQRRKQTGEPEDADALLGALGRTPLPVRRLVSRALASPRLSNLTISNIPGPTAPLYLLGCPVEEAYPIVPLTSGHGISIGMTTVNRRAGFGIYAQAGLSEDADQVAQGIGDHIDELRERCEVTRTPPRLEVNGGSSSPGAVLLTGATGFVGMELLVRYLERSDRTVYALVRADDDEHARSRVRETLVQLFGSADQYQDRVIALAGDVTQRRLGLGPAQEEAVAADVGEIVHAAASVSFDIDLEQARSINVDGTSRLLRFAKLCRRLGGLHRFTYVSTAYVAGEHDGRFSEDDLDVGQRFRNPYEQSKFEAEQLIGEHRGRLPITIVRPGIIVGDRHTGWTPSFNVLYWPLRAFSRGAYPALPARREAPLDVVSVDYVADAVLALAQDPAAEGRTYHLTASERATTIEELLTVACDRFGRDAPPLISPELYRHAVHPVLRRLNPNGGEFLRATESYLPYLAMNVVYDNRRAREALATHGLSPAPLTEYFDPLIDYALLTDWGRRPRTRARAGTGRFARSDPAAVRS